MRYRHRLRRKFPRAIISIMNDFVSHNYKYTYIRSSFEKKYITAVDHYPRYVPCVCTTLHKRVRVNSHLKRRIHVSRRDRFKIKNFYNNKPKKRCAGRAYRDRS